ncbi:lytic transglycosylase domain-containing protein [Clostridium minihomine]|uniref:lytic transglycosylase domain-containing protein n=1 Tax=Clostridium minihomine TaxID=2045012 RepID=UPI0035225138
MESLLLNGIPIHTNRYNGRTDISGSAESGGVFSGLLDAAMKPTDLDAIFDKASQTYHVPVGLLKSVAKAESGFDPNVVSSAGAQGVMQLMPGTAQGLGVTDPFDPEQNIMGGAKYLSQLLSRFDGDVTLAVAAYNAGPGNVAKYGGVPPFAETQNYVKKVLGTDGTALTAGTVSTSALSADSLPPSADLSAFADTSFLGATTAESYLLLKLYQFQATKGLFSDFSDSETPLDYLI